MSLLSEEAGIDPEGAEAELQAHLAAVFEKMKTHYKKQLAAEKEKRDKMIEKYRELAAKLEKEKYECRETIKKLEDEKLQRTSKQT